MFTNDIIVIYMRIWSGFSLLLSDDKVSEWPKRISFIHSTKCVFVTQPRTVALTRRSGLRLSAFSSSFTNTSKHTFPSAPLSVWLLDLPLTSLEDSPHTSCYTYTQTAFQLYFFFNYIKSGCLFIYENTFLHIFKCYCIVYIISIRQMKPCVGWSGVRMWIIEVSVYVTVLWVRSLLDSCPVTG